MAIKHFIIDGIERYGWNKVRRWILMYSDLLLNLALFNTDEKTRSFHWYLNEWRHWRDIGFGL